MTYTCPAGYTLQIDLDANTQWCQGATDINDVKPALPAGQQMGVLGVSSLVAAGLVVAAMFISSSRAARPKRRKSGRRR